MTTWFVTMSSMHYSKLRSDDGGDCRGGETWRGGEGRRSWRRTRRQIKRRNQLWRLYRELLYRELLHAFGQGGNWCCLWDRSVAVDNVDRVVKQTAILKNIRPLPALTLCIALLIEMFIFIPSISTTFRVRNYRRPEQKGCMLLCWWRHDVESHSGWSLTRKHQNAGRTTTLEDTKNYSCQDVQNNILSYPHMPNFLIAGAQKSGTSALYKIPKSHPSLLTTPRLEGNFFKNLPLWSVKNNGRFAERDMNMPKHLIRLQQNRRPKWWMDPYSHVKRYRGI